jgi:hypothetical protein
MKPTKSLLDPTFKYRPSWLTPIPIRYTIPTLRGHYGLVGHYRNQVSEGTACDSGSETSAKHSESA